MIQKRKTFFFVLFVLVFTVIFQFYSWSLADTIAWHEIKGRHFIIYYELSSDKHFAKNVLRQAEKYYRKIGARIGYKRYADFWTWDQRAKIFLFSDQISFTEKTEQPSWSLGYAARDDHLFKSRAIVTYKQERNFLTGLLPHEISHLILHDFFSWDKVPIWFDEGIAQLQEADKVEKAGRLMRLLVQRGAYIPFYDFVRLDIRKERQAGRVEAFYAQSLSIIDFLITKYGNNAFRRLCRNLRDGENFEEALSKAYNNNIKTLLELENHWLKYME